MKKLLESWVCTDPDNHQYGRKIGKGEYEFKELDHRQERDDPEETHPREKTIN
jgi:hypothetical protein